MAERDPQTMCFGRISSCSTFQHTVASISSLGDLHFTVSPTDFARASGLGSHGANRNFLLGENKFPQVPVVVMMCNDEVNLLGMCKSVLGC